MKFRIESDGIDCDSAAFDDDYLAEVARILRDLARRLDAYETDGKLYDSNGNEVGRYGFSTLIRRRSA